MTPMIDVVFLLFIFYLVYMTLSQRESQIDMKLSIAQSGENDRPAATPRITVNIRSDGSIVFAGRDIVPEQIDGRLALAKQEVGDDLEVLLRSSRDTPYGKIEPIMLACTKNGIWNVTYAVYREDR